MSAFAGSQRLQADIRADETTGVEEEAESSSARSATRVVDPDRARLETRRFLDYQQVLATGRNSRSARDASRRWLLLVADVASAAVALVISGFTLSLGPAGYRLLLILGLWLLLNKLLGLYDWDSGVIDKSATQELPKLAQSVVVLLATILALRTKLGLGIHLGSALGFVAAAFVAMSLTRSGIRTLVQGIYGPERALIIGSGTVAKLVVRKLKSHPRYGVDVIGRLDIRDTEEGADHGAALLGDLGAMHKLCREMRVERLIIAFSRLDHEHLLDAIRAGSALGIKVTVVPRLFEVLGHSVVVDDIEGMRVLSSRGGSRTRISLGFKRAIDVVGAALGLLLLAPLLALIAVAIKLDSRGSVIFSQVRIGRGNKPFRIHKFRTMIQDAERLKAQLAHLNEVEFPLLKIDEASDPRLTRMGRLLRRTMLDELPQLWNVLRGEMSIVGPRPLEPADDAEVIGWHRARLELTPGLTGPWQALGRHAIPFREMVTLDYLYVADWSIWNDIKLILRTVPVLLRR